jgi:hypothetical protein
MNKIKYSLLVFFCFNASFLFSQTITWSSTQPTSCVSTVGCALSFTISESPYANTVKVTFTSLTNESVYIQYLTGSSSTYAVTYKPSNFAVATNFASPTNIVSSVAPTNTTVLPNDNYAVKVSYTRTTGGTVVTSTIKNIMIWTLTPQPKIDAPNNSFTSSNMLVKLNIPGYVPDSLPTVRANSKKIVIKDSLSNTYTLTLLDTTTRLILNTKQLSTTSAILSQTNSPSTLLDSLPDGKYKMYFSYQDALSHPVSTDSTSFTLKTFTKPAQIITPTAGSVFTSNTPFKLKYYFPDTLASAAFVNIASPTQNINYPIVTTTRSSLEWAPENSLPDGKYSVKLSYMDFLLNPVAITTVDSILIKTKSATPTILSPLNGSVINTIYYKDTLSEVSSIPDTLSIIGYSTAGLYQERKFAFNLNNLSSVLNYNLNTDPSDGLNTLSLTGTPSLPDGNYLLTRKHQDVFGNPYATSNSVNITVKTATKVPLLISPQSNSTTSNLLTISFVLPDKALTNTAKLIFTNGTNAYQINLNPQDVSSIQSFTWDITASPVNNLISSFSSNLNNGLPSGLYDISLQYQDYVGNPLQSSIQTSVKIVARTISISGNLSFCKGDSVILTASIGNSYLWSNGVTSRSITVKQPGFYSVKVTYDNNQLGVSDSIEIKEFPKPTTPTIRTDQNFNLVSSAPYGNLWYSNGLFNNDTSASIKPSQSNLYTVKTIQNGCASAMSSGYYYLVTNLLSLTGSEFIKLTPNPFITHLNLGYNINGYQKLNMELFDFATGMKLFSKKGLNSGMSVYLGQLSSGIYIVKLSSSDDKVVHQFKMIKQ